MDVGTKDEHGKFRHTCPRRRIVYNVHASLQWKKHTVVWERDDCPEDVKNVMQAMRPGIYVRLYARAPSPGWENHVKEVRIDIFA